MIYKINKVYRTLLLVLFIFLGNILFTQNCAESKQNTNNAKSDNKILNDKDSYMKDPSDSAKLERIDFKNTYAVIVGVLEWNDKSLTAYSKKNRKDKEFCQVLINNSVPQNNITLLLDKKGTNKAMKDALDDITKKADESSLFIFYYAGHGIKQPDGKTYFANYDISLDDIEKTGFDIDYIASIIKKNFKGNKVMLLADCCYSGALAKVVDMLDKDKINAVNLTSADASNTSTGNWTFSQSIIDSFNGESFIDINNDTLITLNEMAKEVFDAMKFREMQMSGFNCKFKKNIIITNTKKNDKKENLNGYGQILVNHELVSVRILQSKNDKTLVEFYDYSDKRDEWISSSEIKPFQFKTYSVGDKITVMWEGQPYDAKVLKVKDEFHYITYIDWSSEWDEWVLSNRIVDVNKLKAEKKENVLVKWGGKLYPAVINEKKNGKFYIHYIGYDDSWNEWVGSERIVDINKLETDGKEKVLVEWQGKWYPAIIKEKKDSKFYIHYLDYDDSWDEWVGANRIKKID